MSPSPSTSTTVPQCPASTSASISRACTPRPALCGGYSMQYAEVLAGTLPRGDLRRQSISSPQEQHSRLHGKCHSGLHLPCAHDARSFTLTPTMQAAWC